MAESEVDYGERDGQIDDFFRAKREWSTVKDEILANYVVCYLRTVGHLRRPILLVDAFAGPGRFGDDSPGSPVLIAEAIESVAGAGGQAQLLVADSRSAHRQALLRNLDKHLRTKIVSPPLESFEDALTAALEVGRDSTVFFYLDPFGIKDLSFELVRKIYERDPSRSTEVLMNFSYRTFMRMSGNWSFADTAATITEKVKATKTVVTDEAMGGNYWLPIVQDRNLDKFQREDAIIEAFKNRLREYFPYVVSVPVKEQPAEDSPEDEVSKYHLIFGTRHPRAICYMNDVAINALAPYFDKFERGLLFEMRPGRYKRKPDDELMAAILGTLRGGAKLRPDIYDCVMVEHFMARLKKEYRALIDLGVKEGLIFPDPAAPRAKGKLNDGVLLSSAPWRSSGAA